MKRESDFMILDPNPRIRRVWGRDHENSRHQATDNPVPHPSQPSYRNGGNLEAERRVISGALWTVLYRA
jgi:hypothetical protein